jgi:hypothetical protein
MKISLLILLGLTMAFIVQTGEVGKRTKWGPGRQVIKKNPLRGKYFDGRGRTLKGVNLLGFHLQSVIE